MDEMQLEVEIRACKNVLSETDGPIVAALEGLLNCTTTTAITNYLKALPDETKNLVTYRADIRQRMKDMQDIIDNGYTGGDGE